MTSFLGQAAIITGGGSGIGLAIAEAMVREGMTVTISGRTAAKLDQTKKALAGHKGRIHTVAGDVADSSHVRELVDQAYRLLGRIDVLVNNAGIGIGTPDEQRSIAEIDEAYWDRMLD